MRFDQYAGHCIVSNCRLLRTMQSVRLRNCSQEWLGPKVFTRQLAYYEWKIWQEITFLRNYLDRVFIVTFWHLCTALLIDSMRLRKGFLWNFWGFPGFSSLKWDQKFILLISGETITKDKGSCDGLESGLRLSRKQLPLGLMCIDSSHHEINIGFQMFVRTVLGARRLLHRDSHSQILTATETSSSPTLARSKLIRLSTLERPSWLLLPASAFWRNLLADHPVSLHIVDRYWWKLCPPVFYLWSSFASHTRVSRMSFSY